jgi:hypothetical protein
MVPPTTIPSGAHIVGGGRADAMPRETETVSLGYVNLEDEVLLSAKTDSWAHTIAVGGSAAK